MKRIRLGAGAALAAGTLAATGLAFAPAALAVTPQTATINASCTIGGSGAATLTATQSGTSATVTLSSEEITAPIALAEDSIQSTLTFVKAGGGTTSFTGTENPALAAGDGMVVGPLTGTVASGDSLEAYGGSLQMVVFGITVSCTASGPQSPGPFVFD
ncbi:hypothetical protein Sipo8835_21920 [Streptomyces ipomoeae]|jgi:hypothetical protein|uniref:Lipoprotein n=2 Tax=Streptomyces ipomoeae TaxID=103232 RepID=L1L5J4_9ACTN|nr:hypothetical protein [Streptomyces ipomoeae]EKX68064.1 hypothetical protein STRIP9103_03020 [Streptomyces ipomoeae 91-03]MDX2696728.1 hypothetical protein [Streptomyces ipomoeae]MDX2823087.1 hypothetical protein [Streptomyces ipomoeae]MDX2839767.1 hypothetical protein [Streptomyces ipomoeae]MDX2876934.1 hypothetical protein [Streptomyces ipomoeae]